MAMSQIDSWKCDVCGYVHEGASPPANCPVCGVEREQFSPLEAVVVVPVNAPAAARWRCTICDYVHDGPEPPQRCPICSADRTLFEPVRDDAASAAGAGDVERVVIVGAGVAGVTAAEHARRHAPDVHVTLLSMEPGPPYYRLNLTRFLAGEVDEDDLVLAGSDQLARQGIELVHDEVVALEPAARRVVLASGGELPYDRLVLAQGAHPFVPPIPGADLAGVHALRTIADARAILDRAPVGARCAVLGGGLLGLETAGALVRRGVEVTVLEGYGYLLPRQLSRTGGELLLEHVREAGIGVRTEVMARTFEGEGRVQRVRLANDEVLDVDLVVVATGIRPNTALARRTGLTVKGGVIVDDRLFTSDPRVLAAGDGTEHRGRIYGIWPASYAQGVVAGTNAVGGEAEFRGIPPANALKVLDVDVFSIGGFEADDGSFTVFEGRADRSYRRIVCRDGRIVGANLVGDTGLANLVREAVESGAQIAERPDLEHLLLELAD